MPRFGTISPQSSVARYHIRAKLGEGGRDRLRLVWHR